MGRYLAYSLGKLRRTKPDRWIELGCLIFVTLFSIYQWKIITTNNRASSAQTDQLITAAKINAVAAQQNASAASSFANTEEKINRDLANAVEKLNVQAQATSEVANATADQAASSNTANGIARQALEDQTRPWIGIDGPLTWNNSTPDLRTREATVTISMKLRDYGQSPAMSVTPYFAFVFIGMLTKLFQEYPICIDAEQRMTEMHERGDYAITVFPGVEGHNLSDVHPDMKARLDEPKLALIGCISYRGPSGKTHYTRAVYFPQTKWSLTPNRAGAYVTVEQLDLISMDTE